MTRVGPLHPTKKKKVFFKLNNIKSLEQVMDVQCILCEVETGFISCTI